MDERAFCLARTGNGSPASSVEPTKSLRLNDFRIGACPAGHNDLTFKSPRVVKKLPAVAEMRLLARGINQPFKIGISN